MKKYCPKCGGDMVVDYGCVGLPDRYICIEPDCDGEIESRKRIKDSRSTELRDSNVPDDSNEYNEYNEYDEYNGYGDPYDLDDLDDWIVN
jgi:hypothetical protein